MSSPPASTGLAGFDGLSHRLPQLVEGNPKGSALLQPTLTAAPAALLAALRLTQPVKRIGGGYETDVFRSDDGRLALKLKHTAGPRPAMLARVGTLRRVAELFQAYLGPRHSLASDYLLIPGPAGLCHLVTVQPFLEDGRPLDSVDLDALEPEARGEILRQLATIVEGALACYRGTGYIPDLYGMGSHTGLRARGWNPRWLMHEGWRIVAEQPLIDAHNLLLTADGRVVLVDYDPLCQGGPGCRLIYGSRALLALRDRRQLAALAAG